MEEIDVGDHVEKGKLTMKESMIDTKISKRNRYRTRLHKDQRNIKSKENKAEVRVEIESDLCKECGLCIEACPVDVLKISEKLNVMGYHPVEYIGTGCTGCGICFYVCPEPGTIRVYKKVRDSKATFKEK